MLQCSGSWGCPDFTDRPSNPRGPAVTESPIPSRLIRIRNPVQLASAAQEPGRLSSSGRDEHTPCLGIRYLESVVVMTSS
jgi:hypothetical protein